MRLFSLIPLALEILSGPKYTNRKQSKNQVQNNRLLWAVVIVLGIVLQNTRAQLAKEELRSERLYDRAVYYKQKLKECEGQKARLAPSPTSPPRTPRRNPSQELPMANPPTTNVPEKKKT